MISKRIAKQSPRSSSMRRLVQYITNPQGTISRVGEVMITNCGAEDPQLAAIEMEAVQSLNTRSKTDKTYHLLVSFRAGEEPDSNALNGIEKEMCAALGYADHQRVAVLHRDTDNLHLHVAINKVHPETFKVHEPFFDYLKLRSARKRLEKEFALSIDSREETEEVRENYSKAQDMEAYSAIESLESWIRRNCLEEIKKAETWDDLHQTMAESGLAIKKRGNGLVIEVIGEKDLAPVKASSIDRLLSKKHSEEKFGEFTPASEAIRQISAKRRYAKGPAPNIPTETLTLFKEYEQVRNASENRQAAELAALDKEYARRAEAARKLRQAEEKFILAGGWSPAKKMRLETEKLKYSTQMLKLRQEFGEKRKKVYVEHGRCTYPTWLQGQAEAGREEAVEALRKLAHSRNHALNKKPNSPAISPPNSPEMPTSVAKGEIATKTKGLEDKPIDKVTKKGTVIYQVGKEVIRHDEDGYTVARASSVETTIEALRMARKRFGDKLTITGNAEFKARVIAAAVEARLKITFTDERMEAERQKLMEKRKEGRKQHEVEKQQGNER